MPALCIEQSYHDPPTVTCVSAAPILKRMKVLKKFKRRMGLAPSRSDSVQHPPLLFHQVCGENVRIDSNGKVARRVESFCKGIAFSSRPVKVGEKVCVRLLEISTNWSGVIRFGFTSQDPVGLRDALPKYACPDLTSKPGYWAKALSERFAEQGLVLYYYYTSTGDVHFGINGDEKGLFFSGVETRGHLWAVIDVYGNSTGVEFLDPLSQLNNRTHIVNDLRPGSTTAQSRVLPQTSSPTQVSNRAIQNRPLPTPIPATSSPPPQSSLQQSQSDVDRVQSTMAQLTLSRGSRHYPFCMTPFSFGNKVIGRNVVFNHDRTLASRLQGEYSHGYVFTQRPLQPGEQIVIRVVETEPLFVGAMAFGLTAANPAGLEANDLPDDCDLLLDRLEYWVVSKDVASSPACGDELAFGLTTYGAVTYSRNGSTPQTIMHVDHSLQLWAFFDVYGNTKMIKVLGVAPITNPQVTRRSITPESTSAPTNTPLPQSRPMIQAPLMVKLPPSPPTLAPSGDNRHNQMRSDGGSPISSVGNSIYIEPVSRTTTISYGGGQGPPQGQQGIPHECTICYEKSVDSVLYMCGHMCMCYECALQQWRGRGGGQCPICRAPIRDVIRTYRS